MQDPNSIELLTTLRDLASSFPGRRLTAVRKLAELSYSNEEIIRSLSATVAQDEDPLVRLAAMQALQNPVHHALIREHPDLLTQGIVENLHAKEEEDKAEEEKIVAGFLARRKRERIYYACFFLAMILYVVILIAIISSGNLQSKDLNCSWVIVFLLAGVMIYLSWRNWRCPNCDSWLGGWKASVNVWWASAPLKCPHCGSKLL